LDGIIRNHKDYATLCSNPGSDSDNRQEQFARSADWRKKQNRRSTLAPANTKSSQSETTWILSNTITFYDNKLSTKYYRFGGTDFEHVMQYKDNYQISETVDYTWNANNKPNDFSPTCTSTPITAVHPVANYWNNGRIEPPFAIKSQEGLSAVPLTVLCWTLQ